MFDLSGSHGRWCAVYKDTKKAAGENCQAAWLSVVSARHPFLQGLVFFLTSSFRKNPVPDSYAALGLLGVLSKYASMPFIHPICIRNSHDAY